MEKVQKKKRKYHRGRSKWICKKEKYVPLSPGIIAASCALELEEVRGEKKIERVVFVILSCYFLTC